MGGQKALKTACIPFFEDKSDQYLKEQPQAIDVETLKPNSTISKNLSTDLEKIYSKEEFSCAVINSTNNDSSSICITDEVNQNNDFIEEEISKDLQNNEKPTKYHGLGTLDSDEKSDKVTYKTTDKVKHEKSHTVKNELSHSSVRKRYNNDVEIIAAVAGTDSIKKVNTKESQYVNLKEINKSPFYYQVKQDKMMLNSRLASMKRGTVFDLVDKNSRYKGQQVYKPYTKPKSKHVFAKSQESHMILTSEQCHETAAKSIHELAGTQKPPTDLDGKSIRVANLVDSKMYENLKNVVKRFGLNAGSNQMTASQFIKNEYDSKLKNNYPPLSKDPITPLSKDFVPPLPKQPLPPLPKQPPPPSPKQPLPPLPQEPTTQNVQFSCNVTLPSSTNTLIPNWHQTPYQQYQSAPVPVSYQPMDCCGINSQNSLLPSPFPTHNITQHSYITAHSTPVVNTNSSHSNHIVPPHSEPMCSSCYCSPYTCNQNSNSQTYDIPSNSTQIKTTNITSEQNNNPFHRGRYASNNSEQFYNNYNHAKQNTYYYQRYRNENPRYPKHSQKCDERRPRNDRWNEHKYHEKEKTDDCSFGKDRLSLREKYSNPVNMLRKQHVNGKIFDRSKSYTDFNSGKTHRGSREEAKTFRNINNNDQIRRDQSRYFNVNKLNSREKNEECFNLNDKESYISPLKNLYESSRDQCFQSVSNHQPISKQLENKQVKKVLKNTSLKVHNNETLDNFKRISKLERPDKNSCITQDIILKNSKNPQNTLIKKSVVGINLTKKYGTIQQSNKPHITETSSTVFDAESKLHNTVLIKNISNPSKAKKIIQKPQGCMVVNNNQNNVGTPINIKPFETKRKMSDKQPTSQINVKQKCDNSNITCDTSISSAEQDSNSCKSNVKRIKYDEKIVVPKKPNKMVKLCQKIQPNSVSNKFSLQSEDENSNDNSTTESQHVFTKSTSSLKRSSNTSGVTRKKYIRKRVKVIYSDSDGEKEDSKQSIPGSDVQIEENRSTNSSGVTSKKYVRKQCKDICSDSDRNNKIAAIKESNLDSDVQKEKNRSSTNTSGVARKKYVRKRVKDICSDSDSSSTILEQSNPSSDVKKKNKLKNLPSSNCIFKNPRKEVLQIVQDCNNLDKNVTNNLSCPQKILKLVNEADDLDTNAKKTHNKVPSKKKEFTNYTVKHKSAEIVHGDKNKTITNRESTETYDPAMSCQKDYDEDTIVDQTKVLNFSAIQTEYKQKLRKKTFNSLTDTGCEDKSKNQENDERKCSPSGVIEIPQNKAQLGELGNDHASVSEGTPVTVINQTIGETKANFPSNSCDTIRDLIGNMKDRSKPEAVQALCQLLVSLCSNSQEDGNVMKYSLEIILKELRNKDDNQSKIITEPHSIAIVNDTSTLGDNSNVERLTSDSGNKNTVGSSEVHVINANKHSEGNAKKEVGVELKSAVVPCLGKQDKVYFENTVGQEPDILNKVIDNDCTPSNKDDDRNRKKLAEKQRNSIKGGFTPENICNEQKKSADRKCTKKGARELDSIHKALNSLPQYSDIMRSGGLRTCRMKNKCEYGLEGNNTSNVKKRRRNVRKTKPPKITDLICNDSLNTSVLPASNNIFTGNKTQVDNCGSEEVLTPTSSSDTVSCSEISLVVNQEINNTDAHEGSSDREIVNVFPMKEEENCSRMDTVNNKINEENECENIAKALLADFEEDLTEKNHPSVIKHTENFFLGKILLV